MAEHSDPDQPLVRNPLKEGWIEKQSGSLHVCGRHLKRWESRWMVLEGAKLQLFKKEKGYAPPAETIDLCEFAGIRSAEDQTQKPLSFALHNSEL